MWTLRDLVGTLLFNLHRYAPLTLTEDRQAVIPLDDKHGTLGRQSAPRANILLDGVAQSLPVSRSGFFEHGTAEDLTFGLFESIGLVILETALSLAPAVTALFRNAGVLANS